MPIVLEHSGGSEELPDETLLIFIDETGHEDLADRNAPYFGFGGCLSLVPEYSGAIIDPWKKIEEAFPVCERPLHAADLRPDRMKPEQMEAISNFFQKGNFGRIAAIASSECRNETKESLYHLLARVLYERISKITDSLGWPFNNIVMVFEHSQRTDKLMSDYFRRYNFEKSDGSPMPVFYATQTKSDEYMPGLSVADFVAHTAGAEVRSRLRGRTIRRKDFQDIFWTSNPSLSSYIEVTKATSSQD